MKKILENPNPTEEHVLVCNKCQCKFSFCEGDTYKKVGSFAAYGMFTPVVTRCPNCGHELLVSKI